MNALAGIAPLFALLLLAIALKFYWPNIAGLLEKKQVPEKHSRDPRLTIGHALSATAMLLLIFSFTYHDERGTTETSTVAPKRITIPPRDVVTPSKQKPKPVQTKSYNIQVVALSKDKIAIIEDGNIVTLKPGQKSPHGWKLISATTLFAKLITPGGERFDYASPPAEE